MVRKTERNISWSKRTRKDFDDFPLDTRQTTARALTQIADGFSPDIAKSPCRVSVRVFGNWS